MIDRFRKFSYFLAYAVATIPLWHYIHDWRILILMVAVIIFAYIMVVLSSVQASQIILNSEKSKIAVPRWLPNKPKYQKWWTLARYTLKSHLLLVPPKMGLALGFVEWSVINGFSDRTYLFHEIYYAWGYFTESLPQLLTIFIAFCLITLFTIAECNLISSFISLGRWIQSTKKKAIFILTSRFLLVFSFLGLVFLARIEGGEYQVYGTSDCGRYTMYIQRGDTNSANQYKLSCYYRRIKETAYLALTTPFEQSILLSANVMRPIRPHSDSYWNWDDNRPFVARQVVAGVLGLMIYAGTTWVILWFVEGEPEHEVT